jgi:hypothetical protein
MRRRRSTPSHEARARPVLDRHQLHRSSNDCSLSRSNAKTAPNHRLNTAFRLTIHQRIPRRFWSTPSWVREGFLVPWCLRVSSAEGARPRTHQHVTFGATPDDKLAAIRHEVNAHTSMIEDYLESCAFPTRVMHSCANVSMIHRLVPLNLGTPMRAQGRGNRNLCSRSRNG